MLKWIGQALGRTTFDIPDGVPKEWVERLQSLLDHVKSLDGARAGLPGDIFSYVMQGEPLVVLQEVSQLPNLAIYLRLINENYGSKSATIDSSIYEDFERVPAAISLRWAKLLEACLSQQSRVSYAFVIPNGIHWPEILMVHAAGRLMLGWSRDTPVAKGLTMEVMENLLAESGIPVTTLLSAAFTSPVDAYYGAEQRLNMVKTMTGYTEAVERHAEVLRPSMLAPAVSQRLHILQLLDKAGTKVLQVMASEFCELATASSKQVRAAAEKFVRKSTVDMVSPLKLFAKNGKPEQRMYALRLLWEQAKSSSDMELQEFCRSLAENDKAPSVMALLDEWAREAEMTAAPETFDIELPTIIWSNPLTAELRAALDGLFAEINLVIESQNKQSRTWHEQMRAQGRSHTLHQFKLLAKDDFVRLRDYIASDEPQFSGKPVKVGNGHLLIKPLVKFASFPGVTPSAALKTLIFFDLLRDDGRLETGVIALFNALHRATGRPTLLELSEMLAIARQPITVVLESYCNGWGDTLARDWPNEAVWPYFAHNLDMLIQYFKQGSTGSYWFDRTGLFRAVETFPMPPERVANTLFELALGTGKTDRPFAQEALAKLPGKEVRIIAALEDGKAEVRVVAAQWLARLCHAPAQAALEKAVVKEKNDVAKGAMLDALQALGQPVEKYLNRDALAKEADKALEKGLPKDLDWFPWDAMPQVNWGDSGKPVSIAVLRWMLVQAVKQKTPEPNAVLRKYCSMFEPRTREAFGQFVLDAWLREDVRPISAEDAMQRAVSQAQSIHGYMQHSPQYFKDDPKFGYTVEQLTAAYLPGFLRTPAGSAISTKGLLAVASACAAERAAPAVGRFLKEYYGTRAAQGKALIAMLAWIEHPSATQLMLSVGNRFRTKSFQEEAMRQAEALAERKGWTVSELADRTIPTAGFDETGSMELSYGERRFIVKLQPDFKVALFNMEGKVLKALPEPRQDEDAELAKDAKKAFSNAKKEIKSIVDLQTDRLYEALCTERDWPFADWNQYLNQHPVVRRLIHRLVWCQVDDGKIVQVFRPLEDGTLTDVNDNEVTLPENARVRIAHDSILSPDQVAKWQQHLQDYEISPLFQQLGKGNYVLSETKSDATEIKDFEGYLLESFALRGRALKLGYTRGAAEDGGWFYTYEKRFPSLGLLAVIEFTGNPLPEESRTVGLRKLSFERFGNQGAKAQLSLGKVPKVLLSECYNDMRLMAADGTGYDADWEKKTEY